MVTEDGVLLPVIAGAHECVAFRVFFRVRLPGLGECLKTALLVLLLEVDLSGKMLAMLWGSRERPLERGLDLAGNVILLIVVGLGGDPLKLPLSGTAILSACTTEGLSRFSK